jgi:hypothetical protein
MTVSERWIETDQETIQKRLLAIKDAQARNDRYSAGNNFDIVVKDQLFVALLKCRNNIENACDDLRKVVELCIHCHDVMTLLTGAEYVDVPNFHLGAFASGILNGTIDERLFRMGTTWDSRGQKKNAGDYDLYLRSGIIEAIRSKQKPDGWEEYNEMVRAKSKDKLMHDTYAAYMDIAISGSTKITPELIQKIEWATKLFKKRETDRYYSDLPRIYGGGRMYNSRIIDFVLACIIRCCLPDSGSALVGESAIHIVRC